MVGFGALVMARLDHSPRNSGRCSLPSAALGPHSNVDIPVGCLRILLLLHLNHRVQLVVSIAGTSTATTLTTVDTESPMKAIGRNKFSVRSLDLWTHFKFQNAIAHLGIATSGEASELLRD